MSFFSDFLIAKPRDARKIAREIDDTAEPTKKWPGFSVKSISSLDLANLYGFLTGKTRTKQVVDLCDEFETLYVEEEGTLIERIPEVFVGLLAELEEDDLSRASAWWAETEEFGGHVEPAVLEELLRQLKDLAARAKADGKAVLLCTSG